MVAELGLAEAQGLLRCAAGCMQALQGGLPLQKRNILAE